MSTDYYEVLGVTPQTDAATIKATFRAIARENHPDLANARRWPPAEAARREKKLKQAAMAYSILSTPKFRAAYERERYQEARYKAQSARRHWNPKAPKTSGVPARWDGFNFEDMRGSSQRRAPAPRPKKPRQLQPDWRSFRELAAEAAERIICEMIMDML